MASLEPSYFNPPNDSPETYCRLCFSMTNVKPLFHSQGRQELSMVQLIWKHLGIQLTLEEDLQCAVCLICQEKLEELHACNEDGLLDEWEDDDLLQFKSSCLAADNAIRNKRREDCGQANWTEQSQPQEQPPQGDKRVVLPFHQLDDGRYKCNVCPNQVFSFISACIKHYQETHPDSSLSEIASDSDNSAMKGLAPKKQSFNCVSCSASFDQIDALIAHRETHKVAKQNTGAAGRSAASNVDSGGNNIVHNSAINGNGDKRHWHSCGHCDQCFDDIDDLILHTSIHTGSIVSNKRQRVIETQNIAPNEPAPSETTFINDGYKCFHCYQQFNDSKGYYFHLNVVHNENLCDVCGEAFTSASKLVRHQATHRNVDSAGTDFVCPMCLTRFNTRRALQFHQTLNQRCIQEIQVSDAEDGVEAVNIENVVAGGDIMLNPQMMVTCGGCFASFDTDNELILHYSLCPKQVDSILLQDDLEATIEDSHRVVEISDDED